MEESGQLGRVAIPIKFQMLNENGVKEFQKIRELNGLQDVPLDEFGRPTLTPGVDGKEVFHKLLEFLDGVTSTDRATLIARFCLNVRISRIATTLEEMILMLLNDNGGRRVVPAAFGRAGQVVVGALRPPWNVELVEENRVDIKTLHNTKALLKMNKEHHNGKFFLCRTITPALNGLICDVIVEDPSGQDAAFLHLVNFTPPKISKNVSSRSDDFLGILPPGSFLAVKSPTRETTTADPVENKIVLQVSSDNPGNVVILTEKKVKELFPDLEWRGSAPDGSFWNNVGKSDAEVMEALKKMGNDAFAFKRYTDAIRCYDMALEYVGEENSVGCVVLWSNKAAAFLGFECFQKGLECCDNALFRNPVHVKSIYRKVKALIGLGKCAEAHNFLAAKLDESPMLVKNKELRSLGAKIPQPGTIPSLKNLLNPSTKFDDFTAEYFGPLEFRPNATSGRGLFATEDIQPGDIISFQRPFAHCDGFIRDDGFVPDENYNESDRRQLEDYELSGIIANKIAFSPDLGPEIYKLWAGEELKILDANDPENRNVNIQRIRKIVGIHSTTYSTNINATLTPSIQFMNRSCTEANAIPNWTQNWIINRASKPIKKDQEILNNFGSSVPRLAERSQYVKDRGMTCNCRLCLLEAEDGPLVQEKAAHLANQIKNKAPTFVKSRLKLNVALEIVTELEQLRLSAPDLRFVMIPYGVQMDLCKALLSREMYKELVNLAEKCFHGAVTMNNPRCAWNSAAMALEGNLRLVNLVKATEWVGEMKILGAVIWGDSNALEAWQDGKLIMLMSQAGMNFQGF